MESWNPEEHYIMIEPNVKYLLSSPGAYKRAPLPWYKRPPPQPCKPPPPDKLRFLSRGQLYNSFERDIPWVPTVADDLDSFTQTMFYSIFLRGGEDTKAVDGLYERLGNETVHYLRQSREALIDIFWRITERRKRALERVQPQLNLNASEDGASESDCGSTALLPEQEGIDVMADALYKLLNITDTQVWQEVLRARGRERGVEETEEERVGKQYENFLAAMGAVEAAAKVMVQRRKAKDEEKQKEKKTQRDVRKKSQGEQHGEVSREGQHEEASDQSDDETMETMTEDDEAESNEEETVGEAADVEMVLESDVDHETDETFEGGVTLKHPRR